MKVFLDLHGCIIPTSVSSSVLLEEVIIQSDDRPVHENVWLTSAVSFHWPPYHGDLCSRPLSHFDLVLTHWKNFGLTSRTTTCQSWERLTWNTLTFISLFSRGDDDDDGVCVCSCIHTWICVCIHVWESVFFSALTLPQGQFCFVILLFISLIVLHQLFPQRSVSQLLRPHGWQWLPLWAAAPVCPAVLTDRWGWSSRSW